LKLTNELIEFWQKTDFFTVKVDEQNHQGTTQYSIRWGYIDFYCSLLL